MAHAPAPCSKNSGTATGLWLLRILTKPVTEPRCCNPLKHADSSFRFCRTMMLPFTRRSADSPSRVNSCSVSATTMPPRTSVMVDNSGSKSASARHGIRVEGIIVCVHMHVRVVITREQMMPHNRAQMHTMHVVADTPYSNICNTSAHCHIGLGSATAECLKQTCQPASNRECPPNNHLDFRLFIFNWELRLRLLKHILQNQQHVCHGFKYQPPCNEHDITGSFTPHLDQAAVCSVVKTMSKLNTRFRLAQDCLSNDKTYEC